MWAAFWFTCWFVTLAMAIAYVIRDMPNTLKLLKIQDIVERWHNEPLGGLENSHMKMVDIYLVLNEQEET